jgi:hypothetical protein
MPIQDSVILGVMPDELESLETQEEVNEISMYMHDQREFLDQLGVRISKYLVDFYMKEFSYKDLEYWLVVLQEIIRVYSLNGLKPFLAEGFRTSQMGIDIRNIVWFLKTKLIDGLVDKKIMITVETSRDDLLSKIKELDAPPLLTYAIDLSDDESLVSFKRAIIKESKMDFPD